MEEQVRCGRVEGDVADLVDDQQLVAPQLLQLLVQAIGRVGLLEAGEPSGRGVEQDRIARVRGLQSQTDREVGLAHPGWPQEHYVLGLGDERAGREVREDVPAERGLVVHREVLQRLQLREVRAADPDPSSGLLALGDLPGQDRGEVLLVAPGLVTSGLGEVLEHPGDRRGLQHPRQIGDL